MREFCRYLESFRLICPGDGSREPDNALIRRWMTTVKLKVKHLDYLEDSWESDESQIPPTIYSTCESLVCKELCGATMSSPEFVSLPSLKVIDLNSVKFPDDLAIETLISGCAALESLIIDRNCYDQIEVLQVCSQSLLTFTHISDSDKDLVEDRSVVTDAPRLKYLVKDMIISSSTLEVIYDYSRCEPLP